jgi:hypothetical protein
LKPYRFIEDKTLQPVLVKPNDLVIDELVQTREPDSLLIKLEGFQLVKFELVCNYSTLGNIKGTNVHVRHYHNVFIQNNVVVSNNDQNNKFRKALIDVYLLGVSNLKGCVHSHTPTKTFLLETI